MDWFEAISENYMDTGGRPLHILEKVRQHYPIALHGTSLSIGSTDPLSQDYLNRLKRLVERIEPFIVSDHLCWCGVAGEALHDLLPLPFTEEAIRHVVRRVGEVQEFLGRRILLENVSAYVTWRHSTMPEWEFLTEVAKRSGALILLDLNNIYVNATNHRFNPSDYLKNIPAELVGQFHLAGHTDMGTYLFDTHSTRVIDPVWELYREALERFGLVSTLIEWDEDIPPFEKLAEEAQRARKIYREYEGGGSVATPVPLSSVGGNQASTNVKEKISLPDLQRWFKSRIEPREKASPIIFSGPPLLDPQGGVSGEERLGVYATGYTARIRETLLEVYEAVHNALGDERFIALTLAYAHRYPSQNYNLNFAGRYLAEFLETHPETRSLPFLPDLARFEWLLWEAFHAFDGPALDPSQISKIPLEEWESARIRFQPSVRLMASKWPLLDLWLARHDPPEKVKVELTNRPQRILVGRKGDQVRCEKLDENQYRLLEALIAGESLGQALEKLAETTEEEMFPVSEWFHRWTQDGLIERTEFTPAKNPVLR